MKNLSASIRARLKNIALKQQTPLQRVMQRYVNERLLHRVFSSPHKNSFVLKGAMLFDIWLGSPHRATKDVDLLGRGSPDLDELQIVFADIMQMNVQPDDGLFFDVGSLSVGPIREERIYGGVRIQTTVDLSGARLPVQIDVGFGDVASPEWSKMVPLLDQPTLLIPTYSKYDVVAEKLEAMVQLDVSNSRMKDFYDIRYLSERFHFEGTALASSIVATFRRRQTVVPSDGAANLLARLHQTSNKSAQWSGFLRKSIAEEDWSFEGTLDAVAAFVGPPLQASRAPGDFRVHWSPAGPWTPNT